MLALKERLPSGSDLLMYEADWPIYQSWHIKPHYLLLCQLIA